MMAASSNLDELPRWVKLWVTAYWSDGPRTTRKQAHVAASICLAGAAAFLAASFLVAPDIMVTMLRVAASFMLITAFLVFVTIRIVDAYGLWPGSGDELNERQAFRRTVRGTIRDYAFVLFILAAFFSAVYFFAG